MREYLLLCFQIALVFGPQIGYVFQYREIAQTKNIQGYAPLVSVILLTSNTLRVYYFFGHRFAMALLLQAAFAIVVHGALLLKVLSIKSSLTDVVITPANNNDADATPLSEQAASPMEAAPHEQYFPTALSLASQSPRSPPARADNIVSNVRVDESSSAIMSRQTAGAAKQCVCPPFDSTSIPMGRESTPPVLIHSSTPHIFLVRWVESTEEWLINQHSSTIVYTYLVSVLVFSMTISAYYAIFTQFWSAAPEVIGYLALGIEATLVIPQILRNARRRSTSGLTLILVLTWVLGDAIKLVYFILDKQPLPFKVCACVQISLDFVVVLQLCVYDRDDEAGDGELAAGGGRGNANHGAVAVDSDSCCRPAVNPHNKALHSPAESNPKAFAPPMSAAPVTRQTTGGGNVTPFFKTKQQASDGFSDVDAMMHRYPDNYMATMSNLSTTRAVNEDGARVHRAGVAITV